MLGKDTCEAAGEGCRNSAGGGSRGLLLTAVNVDMASWVELLFRERSAFPDCGPDAITLTTSRQA